MAAVEPPSKRYSRRALIKRAGALGAAAAAAPALVASAAEAAPEVVRHYAAYTTFGPAEADTLEALLNRIVPADDIGPGAVDLGVGQFIDRAIGGALAVNRIDYDRGLLALDAYSQATYGTPFRSAPPERQDAMITQMQSNALPGFNVDSRTFFNLVKEHTLQGLFGDPYWGGNKNGGGWKLMQIPGIGLDIKPADQELGRTTYISQYKKSTYEWSEFQRNTKGK